MKAAVVTRFGEAPHVAEIALPAPNGQEESVAVVAAGLHPRVRSQAAGTHYTSTDELPLVPGIDGVGRMRDGSLRYFLLPDTAFGSLAERTVIDPRRSIALPEGADPVRIAAAMNPAMSSWVALRRRIPFEPGQSVLVLGATGSAGRLAIAVARRLGAGRVIAAGRGSGRLSDAGADAVVSLDGAPEAVARELGDAARDVDVVLDYLWGAPTAAALRAIVPRRAQDEQTLRWVQIGSVAGPEAVIPSAALRAARLEIVGSGQGSVTTADIAAELGALAAAVAQGAFEIATRPLSLEEAVREWDRPDTAERIVVIP